MDCVSHAALAPRPTLLRQHFVVQGQQVEELDERPCKSRSADFSMGWTAGGRVTSGGNLTSLRRCGA